MQIVKSNRKKGMVVKLQYKIERYRLLNYRIKLTNVDC